MRRWCGFVLFGLLAGGLTSPAWASTISLDFDALSEFDSVAGAFSGITFGNATVLTAGSSLNEFEFPPHSGANVVFDDGGPISITFNSPMSTFAGYFTYAEQLTLSAFGPGGVFRGSVTSAFSNNETLSGDLGSVPNELLGLTSVLGITSVTISGNSAGGSFVLDDATTTAVPAAVPEPPTIATILAGLAGLARLAHNRRCG